jgi:hypothetical protein
VAPGFGVKGSICGFIEGDFVSKNGTVVVGVVTVRGSSCGFIEGYFVKGKGTFLVGAMVPDFGVRGLITGFIGGFEE